MQFKGKVVMLSKQKFSSNVIEKVMLSKIPFCPTFADRLQCIRVADDETRQVLVEELIMPHSHDMERILRDSFANYVVQTAVSALSFLCMRIRAYISYRLTIAIEPLKTVSGRS
jgi:hypothetical protein